MAAAGDVDADVQRKLREIEQLVVGQTATGTRTRAERTAAGDNPSAVAQPSATTDLASADAAEFASASGRTPSSGRKG